MKKMILVFLLMVSAATVVAEAREKQISVREMMEQVERVYHVKFVYDASLDLQRPYAGADIAGMTLRQSLEHVFRGTGIGFTVRGEHVLLRQERRAKPVRKYTVSGYITDGNSSETLIGARVFDNASNSGTVTNPYGYFTLTLPEGTAHLDFSYMGYAPHTATLKLSRDTLMNVGLQLDNTLQEVVVTAQQKETGIIATGMGALDVPVAKIKHTPSLLGETDVIRTVQLMPGVQSGNNGSAGLYVRGGAGDENLILLDGIPVYNINHLFGFFSVFTPEAMKKVTFFKGSFPSRFSGRLSSVIDVRTKDGDMYHYHGSASIGLLTSRLNFEGPIVKGKTSFNITARRSYLDLLMRPFMKDDKFSYYFYDINAKVNHKFSDTDRIYLSYYRGRDYLSQDLFDDNSGYVSETASGVTTSERVTSSDKYGSTVDWGSAILSFRWNHVFSDKLFCNTTLSYNHYQDKISTYDSYIYNKDSEKLESSYNSQIKDWSVQSDFDYNPSPVHHAKFGAQYIYHLFCPEIARTKAYVVNDGKLEMDTVALSPSRNIYAHEMIAYFEDNWRIGERWHVNMGLTLSDFIVQKKGFVSLQPRLSARYRLTDDIAFKAAYSRMSQNVHLLTSIPISMPTDLWVPITKGNHPETADQYSVGAYYTGVKDWELSVEAYYKHINHVLEYKDGITFTGMSTDWQNMVEAGTGRSYGVELMLEKKTGRNTGWISYTLSKSNRLFPDGGINGGERFPYTYDRRHNINLFYNHRFSGRVSMDASWMFFTGGAVTIPTQVSEILLPDDQGAWRKPVYYVPSRNNYRMPSSSTLSLGINVDKKLKHGASRTWNFSIYNALNQMNPMLLYLDDNSESNYHDRLSLRNDKLTKYTLLPFIPSFTYTYRF